MAAQNGFLRAVLSCPVSGRAAPGLSGLFRGEGTLKTSIFNFAPFN